MNREASLERWLHALIETAPAGVWAVAWLMRDLDTARGLLVELERANETAGALTIALFEAIDTLREERA